MGDAADEEDVAADEQVLPGISHASYDDDHICDHRSSSSNWSISDMEDDYGPWYL
ncbi:hypothetical protein H310_15270 [Aphanomyces invadans]|uniref:Uncharacterized protein n=1 Tax=Aphanomyces invadans TaxID=157072 RepID=A0A024T7Q8_9STRA|nr:hypothetical protein H310_15270 [Aphanomyces invadans]ETV89888.1 hypothetical protein H310_15270 [Aphanomyces invadans]|eukprot:XP_008881479.1 hypothetical protein H310_15270 [Aphanomyces invadans]